MLLNQLGRFISIILSYYLLIKIRLIIITYVISFSTTIEKIEIFFSLDSYNLQKQKFCDIYLQQFDINSIKFNCIKSTKQEAENKYENNE